MGVEMYDIIVYVLHLWPIINYVNLKIYKSWDFFLINYLNLEKINLEIFGGHLAIFFCEVNLEIFLEIFVSRDLLFNIYCNNSRDFLSFFICVSSWSSAQLEPPDYWYYLVSNEAWAELNFSLSLYYYYFQMRLELNFSSAQASIIIIIILKWGLSWSSAQLEPLLLIVSNEARAEVQLEPPIIILVSYEAWAELQLSSSLICYLVWMRFELNFMSAQLKPYSLCSRVYGIERRGHLPRGL